ADLLNRAGVRFEGQETLFELDMSYLGQTHTVAVPLPLTLANGSTGVTQDLIREAFEVAYKASFGRLLDGIAMRVLNLRVAVIGKRPKFDLTLLAPRGDSDAAKARIGTRPVFADGAWHEAALYDRLSLPIDSEVPGPALLEQPDTTIFIEPDLQGRVDRFGNLLIGRKEQG
ncbi:MAG: hydantoinase/oxoprolinase family protein, partial [Pseudomonadota bacterium]